jgi:hypothetical protein
MEALRKIIDSKALEASQDALKHPKGALYLTPAARLCSLLTTNCSLLPATCSLLTATCSLLTANCSLLTTTCSLLTTTCQPHTMRRYAAVNT